MRLCTTEFAGDDHCLTYWASKGSGSSPQSSRASITVRNEESMGGTRGSRGTTWCTLSDRIAEMWYAVDRSGAIFAQEVLMDTDVDWSE